jgi:hypothetical protein
VGTCTYREILKAAGQRPVCGDASRELVVVQLQGEGKEHGGSGVVCDSSQQAGVLIGHQGLGVQQARTDRSMGRPQPRCNNQTAVAALWGLALETLKAA